MCGLSLSPCGRGYSVSGGLRAFDYTPAEASALDMFIECPNEVRLARGGIADQSYKADRSNVGNGWKADISISGRMS